MIYQGLNLKMHEQDYVAALVEVVYQKKINDIIPFSKVEMMLDSGYFTGRRIYYGYVNCRSTTTLVQNGVNVLVPYDKSVLMLFDSILEAHVLDNFVGFQISVEDHIINEGDTGAIHVFTGLINVRRMLFDSTGEDGVLSLFALWMEPNGAGFYAGFFMDTLAAGAFLTVVPGVTAYVSGGMIGANITVQTTQDGIYYNGPVYELPCTPDNKYWNVVDVHLDGLLYVAYVQVVDMLDDDLLQFVIKTRLISDDTLVADTAGETWDPDIQGNNFNAYPVIPGAYDPLIHYVEFLWNPSFLGVEIGPALFYSYWNKP